MNVKIERKDGKYSVYGNGDICGMKIISRELCGLDKLGRLTIPVAVRRRLAVKTEDPLYILLSRDGIWVSTEEENTDFENRFFIPIGEKRAVDSLGRIVLPKYCRNYFGITYETCLELKETERGFFITVSAE